MKYLCKIHDTYYFRMRIPSKMLGHIERKAIKISLNTDSYLEGQCKVAKLTYQFNKLFKLIEVGMLSKEQIPKLVQEFIDCAHEGFEELRVSGELSTDCAPLSKDLDVVKERLREKIINNDWKIIEKLIDAFLADKKIEYKKDTAEYKTLLRDILKNLPSLYNSESARNQGEYENEYDSMLRMRSGLSAVLSISQENKTEEKGILLSKLIEVFCKDKIYEEAWTEKSELEMRAILKNLLEIIGDVDVKILNHEQMRNYREIMTKLPANRNKLKAYRDKTIEDILKMPNVKPMHPTTVKKNIIRVSGLFQWAVDRGYMNVNYAKNLAPKLGQKAQDERKTYSKEDIEKIVHLLNIKNYKKTDQKKYWIPIISMFSGLRLREVCQLYKNDILQDEKGIWYFDINKNAPDKMLKNASAVRVVPMHSTLIELGLLEVVNSCKEKRLWPSLKFNSKNGYSHGFGKWYNKDFNRVYITQDEKKSFHSFRHTVIDKLELNRIEEHITAGIVGQKHKPITYGRYGKTHLELLQEALETLDYGFDMTATMQNE